MAITDDEALLESADRDDVGRGRKEIWSATRVLQNSPTADVHRYTFTGGDKSKMKIGTRVDSGSLARACTVTDFSKQEAQRYGNLLQIGDKAFAFYDYEVVLTDIIEYPSGALWDVIRVNYNSYTGRCDVLARKQKA